MGNAAYQPFIASSCNKLQDFIPSIIINPDSLILYDKYTGSRHRSKVPKINVNRGIVSSKQAKRIRYYVNLLVDCSRSKKVYQKSSGKWYSFKVNLITLTLPSKQCHSDREIHEKCFQKFINAWRKLSPELLYIYKAEVQDNGNLHYHLTTNTFIRHDTLRDLWNRYINKLGYVDRSGVKSPNSTDVHSVKSVKNLAAYMVSYLTKKDLYTKSLKRYHRRYSKVLSDRRLDECRLPRNYFQRLKRKVVLKVWDCSKSLMIGKCSMEIDSDDMMNDIRKLLAVNTEAKLVEWCIYMPLSASARNEAKTIANVYRMHIAALREHTKSQATHYEVN